MDDDMAELAAINAYQQKHTTCDIQRHPWQAVFGSGFAAGREWQRAQAGAQAGAPAAPSEAVRAAAARLLHETDLHRDTAPAPDDSLLTFEADIVMVARYVLEGAGQASGEGRRVP